MVTVFLLLMSSMIGIGFLTLPVISKESGIILGIIIVVLCGFFSFFGSFQVIRGRLTSVHLPPEQDLQRPGAEGAGHARVLRDELRALLLRDLLDHDLPLLQ